MKINGIKLNSCKQNKKQKQKIYIWGVVDWIFFMKTNAIFFFPFGKMCSDTPESKCHTMRENQQ